MRYFFMSLYSAIKTWFSIRRDGTTVILLDDNVKEKRIIEFVNGSKIIISPIIRDERLMRGHRAYLDLDEQIDYDFAMRDMK